MPYSYRQTASLSGCTSCRFSAESAIRSKLSCEHLTGLPWIPCHSVILFDLNTNRIVNPFIDSSLQPDVVMAISATFAPDGGSLLCLVLGDDSLWLSDSFFSKASLFQIRIDDGSFDARRMLKTTLTVPSVEYLKLSWLKDNSILIHSWMGIMPNESMQIVIPAAFGEFID